MPTAYKLNSVIIIIISIISYRRFRFSSLHPSRNVKVKERRPSADPFASKQGKMTNTKYD
jgi:hypothetical protein